MTEASPMNIIDKDVMIDVEGRIKDAEIRIKKERWTG
jgi:hypothetical protein